MNEYDEIPLEDTGHVFVGSYGYTKELNMPEKTISYQAAMKELQNKEAIYQNKLELIRHHATAARRYFEEGDDDGAMKELELLNEQVGGE